MAKISRTIGRNFEQKVRRDLEENKWIVCRWLNNVEFEEITDDDGIPSITISLIPAKYSPKNRWTGFPDFIAFRRKEINSEIRDIKIIGEYVNEMLLYQVIGVESKVNKYLTNEEKEKCRWLLHNNIFSKILIAYRGKRGKIKYEDFENA